MAVPLQEGTHIFVERKRFEPGYCMPSMEIATDHYSISYIISGDRKIVTSTSAVSCHAGDISMCPPFVYHRTLAESEEIYERILIKFSPDFVEPFIREVGQQFFDRIYEQWVCYFLEEAGQKIRRMFLDMEEEYRKDGAHKEFILRGMLFRLLLAVGEEKLPDEKNIAAAAPITNPIMDAVCFVENSYMKNPSLEEAARVANFSAAYFSRLFHAQLGMSYSTYLDNVKLLHAQILLVQTDKTIMEIAQETGYSHGNYLSERFRKKIGMTPGKYRKNAGKGRNHKTRR